MNKHLVLSIFHILFVAPLFLIVGFMRSTTPDWLYMTLTVLGLIILVYHGYKLVGRWYAGSSYWWVNAIHVAFVAPLMIYIGAKQKDGPRYGYELLAMVGFAALGYHLYSLIRELQLSDDKGKL